MLKNSGSCLVGCSSQWWEEQRGAAAASSCREVDITRLWTAARVRRRLKSQWRWVVLSHLFLQVKQLLWNHCGFLFVTWSVTRASHLRWHPVIEWLLFFRAPQSLFPVSVQAAATCFLFSYYRKDFLQPCSLSPSRSFSPIRPQLFSLPSKRPLSKLALVCIVSVNCNEHSGTARALQAICKVADKKTNTYSNSSRSQREANGLRRARRSPSLLAVLWASRFTLKTWRKSCENLHCSVCSLTRRRGRVLSPRLPPLHWLISSSPCSLVWRSSWSPRARRPEDVHSLCCATPATGPWKMKHETKVRKRHFLKE